MQIENPKQSRMATLLRQSRKEKNLTQSEVSRSLGYKNAQFISNWERGLAEPPVHAWKTLKRLYEIDNQTLYRVFIETGIDKAEAKYRNAIGA
jgi:transcriptional regulator with XRE-family HTH domain